MEKASDQARTNARGRRRAARLSRLFLGKLQLASERACLLLLQLSVCSYNAPQDDIKAFKRATLIVVSLLQLDSARLWWIEPTLRYSTLLSSTRRLFSSSILFQVILPTRELFQFLLAFIYFLFRQGCVDDDVYLFLSLLFFFTWPSFVALVLVTQATTFSFLYYLSTVLFIKRLSKHSRIYARDNPGYEWCFFLQLRLQRRSFPRRPDSLFSIYVGWFDWVGLALFFSLCSVFCFWAWFDFLYLIG